ncbi:MarR family transcriptional regulator [Streptomyces sp. NPDC026672]|uniref:MarR family winged helix-turn-helix transcriptional regulator n=1 Tax=unclassified Streptomyces TaxID=2593676 RepID=UPI0033DCCC88
MPSRRSDHSSPIHDPLLTTFGRLIEASNRSERWMARRLQDQCALPHPWFEVLLRLARSEGGRLTMGELAVQTTLTSGGITKLVDRLEAAGFVARVPCPKDRRVAFASITDDGRAKLDEAARYQRVNVRELFHDFTEDELTLFDGLMDRLRGAAPGAERGGTPDGEAGTRGADRRTA